MKIQSETEYDKALIRLEEIFDSEEGTPESDELGILINDLAEYEAVHYPMDEPSEEEQKEFRKDQMNTFN